MLSGYCVMCCLFERVLCAQGICNLLSSCELQLSVSNVCITLEFFSRLVATYTT